MKRQVKWLSGIISHVDDRQLYKSLFGSMYIGSALRDRYHG
jgi:hypothetical protein